MQPFILPFKGKTPSIHPSAFIAPGAVIIGDVTIGAGSSVWYGCVLRGDSGAIVIGKGSNIQDGTIIHEDSEDIGGRPCTIGDNVLVGHRCILHGCDLQDGAFIGMGATVLDFAVVETGGFLAAGAFLGPRKTVATGTMWAGLPAKKIRDLKPGEDKMALMGSAHYQQNAKDHCDAIAELARAPGTTEVIDAPCQNLESKN